MLKLYDNLTNEFRRRHGELDHDEFFSIVKKYSPFRDNINTFFFLLQASGYPIEETASGYRLKSFFTPWRKGKFCVVDIETNGSKPGHSQVIEAGAVIIKAGEIIDRFESFAACTFLPEQISRLTGIHASDLEKAPELKEVLRKLRNFMGDAVFVAHNVKFDYSFLNASFQRFGLGSIGNQTLCTIDLAKRTFKSERYGLAYLNEHLKLGMQSHHRAYCDALATSKILMKSMENIPDIVVSTDELIRFSKNSVSKTKRSSAKK